MTGLLIDNIGTLVTNDPELGDGPLGVVHDAALVFADGVVRWAGPRAATPEAAADERFDAGGRAVIPGFVDSHAHIVFAGDRTAEFAARMAGRPYNAGGIRTTVAATRAASTAQLEANMRRLVAEALRSGTTTIECKSGYGLTVEDERRSLQIAGEHTDEVTYMGAHVVAPEFAERPDEYVELVCTTMLDACAPHARWIDVFCERGAFDGDQTRAVLRAGIARGLVPRVHANQLTAGPGVQIAVELDAASADHVTHASDADIDALAGSRTVATLLPAAEFSTRAAYPDARRLLDAGVTVALAADCNPGSAFTTNIPFCIALAVREMGMTPDEAVWAATLGGARALRRSDVGHLGVGARADAVLLDAHSHIHLAYRPGVPLVAAVWRRGAKSPPSKDTETPFCALPRHARKAPRRMVLSHIRDETPTICSTRARRGGSNAAMSRTQVVTVGVGPVTPEDVVAVARHGAPVALSDEALAAIATSREIVDGLAGHARPHYGVSTGFGALATRHIPADLRVQLQRSLIRSHAAGSGAEVEREVVRALMLLRLSTLATGRTGVRARTAEAYAGMLSAGITPIVREYGSLGCSGDLAPLAHCALALMGEGPVRDATGELREAADALADAGIEPIELREKEGLALINGTDGMLGMLLLAIADLRELLIAADITAAMSVEGLLGTDRVFAADLQALRPHPGQAASAANVRTLLAGSEIVASHRGPEDPRVQDAYSLRCAPAVAGGARDTVDHAAAVAARELASAIDNPVITLDGRVESNGNFHGAPVAYALDFLAIVVADVASMAERRTDRFLDVARNHGLPAFLAGDPGVDSGHMIAQYTQAAIVSELKRLAVPASADSIPSSAMQEDHVSMGWSAGRKLRRAVDGLTRVLAIELLTAARGIDLRAPLAPAPATAEVLAALRETVAGPGPDRVLAPEIEAAVELVRSGGARRAAETVTGPLA